MESSLIALLNAMSDAGVDFILVGGLAAVIQGAPIHTYDVDLVFSQDSENILRLLPALDSLDAIFRIQPSRKLRPNASHLAGNGHLNLQTKFGPLDLLTNIGDGLRYAKLLEHSHTMQIGAGRTINVLNLETLIELKEKLAGSKDLAALPILRQTLRESKKRTP